MNVPTLIVSKTSLPLAEISTGHRLRPVSAAGVATIVASLRELGQLANAIVVRQVRRGGVLVYELLDGAHRLAAAEELGWAEVPVRVFECSDDAARLMEIDGNLAGAELNPLDTAVFLATRKAVYEKLHPEAKAGVAGALKRWTDANDIVSFAQTTAEKFGLSKRHVERMVAAGSRLGPDEIAKLRAAPKAVTLKDLLVIAKIGPATDRYAVVDMLANGRAKSAADAMRRAADPARPPVDPVEAEYLVIKKAWSRARKIAKRRFVADLAAELDALLGDVIAEAEDQEREHM